MELVLKSAAQRGDAVGGSYIKRVVTGTDKDGSPQYRYLRTKEEVDAYEGSAGKQTHEKQKKEHEDQRRKTKKKSSKKDKKKESLLVRTSDKDDDKKVEKSLLYIKVSA